MLLNFGILLVALIIYLCCNPGVIRVFFEDGMNGVVKYNEEKREDKIREAISDKRKELCTASIYFDTTILRYSSCPIKGMSTTSIITKPLTPSSSTVLRTLP